jgi:outer membrane protein OmpA-like peptidoglycan-associated protein
VETVLGDLHLPAPATIVDYRVTNSANDPPTIHLVYLSERDIEPDGQLLLVGEIQKRFENSEAIVTFERIDTAPISLTFDRNQTKIEKRQEEVLDNLAERLRKFPSLLVEISANAESSERDGVAKEREQAIAAYLTESAKVDAKRLELKPHDTKKREVTMQFISRKPDAQ